ncbi:MAG: CTP synthase [Bacteroidales bacterium]|nr:CTP synthase [Bacteroidales bacterium]HNZ41919.1 CTP synthase [Bacteroidales bacterium]
MPQTKFIFVTGGVTSSLGKGIISASLAKLLQARGFAVLIQKFDPYINIDPGTLNPYEHGECFVTNDGAETDLDLGHYERFLNVPTSQANNVTTGRIYQSVINRERHGDYLGQTVQVIPHITDEIKYRMKLLAQENKPDFLITEIGGTVGDIESLPFIEAVRQMKWELGETNCLVVHLTLIPYLSAAGELKTKPTQHSVKNLLELGVQPDILVCRTEKPLNDSIKNKIALFCNVSPRSVVESIDTETIYNVPLLMHQEQLDVEVLEKTRMPLDKEPDLEGWKQFLFNLKNPKDEIKIALVGKYVELKDAYKSIIESFIHAGSTLQCKIQVKTIQSEYITPENVAEQLNGIHGLLVAPGFGARGIEGKITAIRHVRENNIPFFGICLGMQCAVIEFARNVLHYGDAHSTEINPETTHPVIDIMESQKIITDKGGTMRLGAYPCHIKNGALVQGIYQSQDITERHRHRYEFNNDYLKAFEEAGMIAAGVNPALHLVEIMEYTKHPWFVGVQYHPEYKSTVQNPHPLFVAFAGAALRYKLSTK